MKDLKHLYYFEKLLDEANNELVREAQKEGRICVGNVCSLVPEVLLDLPGTFTVRLRAPRTGSMEMGTYYLTSFLCEYSRALLERALEGGYQFLDCLIAPDACSMINRAVENMELLKTMTKEKFFYRNMEIPMKADDNGLSVYVSECRSKILEPLHEIYGIDTSEEALLTAVENHNKVCKLITEIGEFRKEENPRITGYEYHMITLASYVCPKDLLVEKLEETLEELKTREPDSKKQYRAKVVMAGSEIDDVDMIKLVEESGALVVADRFCFGALPGREEIPLNHKEDIVTQVCRHYMYASQCARYMNKEKIQGRQIYVDQLAREYHADGIIYQQMKFCDYWAYERMVCSHVLREDYGYPVLSVDRPYAVGASGQLRTRVQAFVESIEIKKIQKNRGGVK
ncbi:MAG: 2-hydroxyacyl-CoA dehydratase [Lachnospiraceae bacterium]|nr:2-hydroxyacyl-CoA dehydratase [Lachnospiraceae bacterium]